MEQKKEETPDLNKLAETYADSIDRRGTSYWVGLSQGFKAGYQQQILDKDKENERLMEEIKHLKASIDTIYKVF